MAQIEGNPMAFFKSDPESSLQKQIDAERVIRDQLEVRLIAARKTAAECQSAARKATRDLADEKILSAAEEKEIAAERRVANTMLELTEATSKIAEIEKQLAAAVDQRIRKGTVAEIEQIAALFASAVTNANAALGDLAAITETMAGFLPDARGLAVFSAQAKAELPSPVMLLTAIMKNYSDGVLAGHEKATLPKVEVVTQRQAPASAPMLQVCVLKPVAWLDAAGLVQTAPRGEDISLPEKTAKHAIKINAACLLTDERRKIARRVAGTKPGRPLRRNCIDLDDGMPADREAEPFVESILRSSVPPMFTVVDRGPPKQMQVARNEPKPTKE
jgi:hypothetical protein